MAEANPIWDIRIGTIVRASIPAILNNAAAPLAEVLQLAVCGRSAEGTSAVAAFSAVNAVTSFVANVMNFLVVVVMARVGHALGARQWAVLDATVRAALTAAAAIGGACALALWLLRLQVLTFMSLSPSVGRARELALLYLPYALLRVPALLLLRAASSTLVGYQRLLTASTINTLLALADGTAFALIIGQLERDIGVAGAARAVTCAIAAVSATAAVLLFPPSQAVAVGDGIGSIGGNVAPEPPPEPPPPKPLLRLAFDSANVFVRSLLLSGSILALSAAAAALGTDALAAHAVVMQLWMVTSYVVDGFADVGTMLGSRLVGGGQLGAMRSLTRALALLGVTTGALAAALLALLRQELVGVFTRPDATRTRRMLTSVWPLLSVMQLTNAVVFVYDGVLYATQSYAYMRSALLLGSSLVFAPALAAAAVWGHSLVWLWAAKSALNGWRCLTALYRIHVMLWPQWREGRERTPAALVTSPTALL